MDGSLDASPHQVVYFDVVVAEAISVLGRRYEERKRSAEFVPVLRTLLRRTEGEIIWILPEVPALYPHLTALVEQSQGRLNFNDALIALVMQEQGLQYRLSFDADFDTLPWVTRMGGVEGLEALRRLSGQT